MTLTDHLAKDRYPLAAPTMPHSRMGVASFVLGMVGNCLIWGTSVAIAGLAVLAGQGKHEDLLESGTLVGGIVILCGFLCNLVGLPLGAAALFQRDRRLLYAIIGLSICALTVVGWGLMAALGFAASVHPNL